MRYVASFFFCLLIGVLAVNAQTSQANPRSILTGKWSCKQLSSGRTWTMTLLAGGGVLNEHDAPFGSWVLTNGGASIRWNNGYADTVTIISSTEISYVNNIGDKFSATKFQQQAQQSQRQVRQEVQPQPQPQREEVQIAIPIRDPNYGLVGTYETAQAVYDAKRTCEARDSLRREADEGAAMDALMRSGKDGSGTGGLTYKISYEIEVKNGRFYLCVFR